MRLRQYTSTVGWKPSSSRRNSVLLKGLALMPEPATLPVDGSGGGPTDIAGQPRKAVGAASRDGVNRSSGGDCCGSGLAVGMAPQLEQVVGAAQQLPLCLAGGQPPPKEPAGALLLLQLAEDRLHAWPVGPPGPIQHVQAPLTLVEGQPLRRVEIQLRKSLSTAPGVEASLST
jgi:hypothetical protein